MKDEFCCEVMNREIHWFENKELDINGKPMARIWYNRQYRMYGLLNYCGDWNDVSPSGMSYCPFCGKKLPKELDEIDMEAFLRKEYGWTDEDCWGHPMRELPKEFQTDEWWKKRGL